MPYEPNAPTEKERSGAYATAWIGLAFSLVLVFASVLSLSDGLRGVAALIVGLHILGFLLSRWSDSYFKELRNFAACVAFAVVALWLAANGLLHVGNLAHAAGIAVAGADPAPAGRWMEPPAALNDVWLLAGLSAVGFYAGFLFDHHKSGR